MKGFNVFDSAFARNIFIVNPDVVSDAIWKRKKHNDAAGYITQDRPLGKERNSYNCKNRRENKSDISKINAPDENQSQYCQYEYGDIHVFNNQSRSVFQSPYFAREIANTFF